MVFFLAPLFPLSAHLVYGGQSGELTILARLARHMSVSTKLSCISPGVTSISGQISCSVTADASRPFSSAMMRF
ncbi:hypothetical protein EDC04DRAFT_2703091 [Pisolithus marmoratus]|nr:hypothetical protein EDC04DRAFT_2703091 [Pisolithus marmoratus]